MNWFTKFFSRKKAVTAQSFFGNSYVDIFNKQRKPDKAGLLREYKGVAYACANLNAQAIVKTDLDLFAKTAKGKQIRWGNKALSFGEVSKLQSNPYQKVKFADNEQLTEITSHPLLNLLANPNPYMDQSALFEFTQLFQEVVGSAYWYIAKNALGVPVQIWLLCPQFVQPQLDTDGNIEYYIYGVNGKRQRYEVDEIIPFLLPNLQNPGVDGMSPLDSVFESIAIENKYSATESAMLDNEGRPAGILSAKDGLGQDEAERWERKFNSKFRQAGNGGVIVLDEDATFEPIAYRPRDLSRLEIHSNAKIAICNAYLVPPAMLNDTAGSQYNVDVTIRQRHVEDAIIPRLRRIQSVLNRHLVPLFDTKLFVCFSDASPTNREIKLREDYMLVQIGIKTPNEARAERGLPPRPDGEGLQGMFSKPAAEQSQGDEQLDPPEDVVKGCQCGHIKKKGMNPYKLPNGKPLQECLKTHFQKQKREVVTSLDRHGHLPAKFVAPKKWATELYKDALPILKDLAAKNYQQTLRDIEKRKKGFKVATGTDVVSPQLEQAVRDLVLQFCDSTLASTTQLINDALDELRAELEAGLLAGEDINHLADRVSEVFDNLAEDHSWTIAQTESSRVHHTAQKEAAIASGVCTGFELLPSSACCDMCQDIADAGPIALDGSFYNDPSAPPAYQDKDTPPIHPNCECSMTYVLSEDEGDE